MTSKLKTLVTLTVLRIVEGVGIHYAVTDGHGNTIQASSSNFERLEKDFLAVVKELIQGNPTYKEGDINFGMGDWVERSVRFAIDQELVSTMISEYRENAEGAEIVKLSEYFINFFDKVNGNNAVSGYVGIQHIVKGIQAGDIDLTDVANPITKLVDVMLKHDAWSVDNQGIKVIEGKLTEFGEDISFNACSAVGNVFVEGNIGKLGVRIFKAQNVQIYIGWGTDFPERPEVFQVFQGEKIIQRLYDAAEISANSPA